MPLAVLSSLHGPESSWPPVYDVQQRMWELEKFWAAGVTAALYDALKHVKTYPYIDPPPWILDGALKAVEDRLRAGFETKKVEIGIAAIEGGAIVSLGDRRFLPDERRHGSVKPAFAARTSRSGAAA